MAKKKKDKQALNLHKIHVQHRKLKTKQHEPKQKWGEGLRCTERVSRSGSTCYYKCGA